MPNSQKFPRIFLSPPHMSGNEQRLVAEAFDSNFIAPAGPMLARFEQALCHTTGFEAACALTSGTAAMHLALRCLGVGAGDAVWTSTLTFIGGVAPVCDLGAEPVFLDVSAEDWTIDVALLEEQLAGAERAGRLPKVIIPVDLYGQCCDLGAIMDLASQYAIPVLVDSAEALGASDQGRHAGKGASAAVYSFNGNKIITTSGGGALACDDASLVERARYFSQQARQPVPHYEHTETGYNYRMSSIAAAIGLGQFEVLEARVKARRAIFDRYKTDLAALPGIGFSQERQGSRSNRWLTVITLDPTVVTFRPEDLRLHLEAHNIEARPVWKPMHQQPVFVRAQTHLTGMADQLFARGLCLPSGSGLMQSEQERVITCIQDFWSTRS